MQRTQSNTATTPVQVQADRTEAPARGVARTAAQLGVPGLELVLDFVTEEQVHEELVLIRLRKWQQLAAKHVAICLHGAKMSRHMLCTVLSRVGCSCCSGPTIPVSVLCAASTVPPTNFPVYFPTHISLYDIPWQFCSLHPCIQMWMCAQMSTGVPAAVSCRVTPMGGLGKAKGATLWLGV